eukprot:NODE_47_length_32105_cov_1.240892.p27 type:complete len:114 gc:universal NODE_47_length_32105_cov_1.240892:21924-21583(-)
MCEANKQKATSITDGKCPPAPPVVPPVVICTADWNPVCGTVSGKRKTFSNQCEADRQKATEITGGDCEISQCPATISHVCGTLNKKKYTFKNKCRAQHKGASSITDGACPKTK